jgi:hypothetical protein
MPGMRPSFDCRDLLPFQILGALGVVSLYFWLATAGLLSIVGLLLGIVFVVFALRSVPVR